MHVEVLDAAELDRVPSGFDLIIDGAFGTGLTREWSPPAVTDRVLALDVSSGLDALTGECLGTPWEAEATFTLAALKPGLLLGHGPALSGEIHVADIDLDLGAPHRFLIEAGDVATWLPERPASAHKWNDALLVVAGSPGMTGAASLVCHAAMRAGAGYVHLDTAATDSAHVPIEVVSSLGGTGVTPDPDRFSAAVVGPGLGRSRAAQELVATVLTSVDSPIVLDGDGLSALAALPQLLQGRSAPTVLTPHDGEYERLMGDKPSPDRFSAAKAAADRYQCVVLLKGPTTIVAQPDGPTFASTSGDARLATAGTGDVLAGVVGAFLARGVEPAAAAISGAFVHGVAGSHGPSEGLIASDLTELIPKAMSEIRSDSS